MQFADLMKLFREGQNEGRKRGYVTQGACDAEGVTAIVRALRDEISMNCTLDDDYSVYRWLDKILGDAGAATAGAIQPQGEAGNGFRRSIEGPEGGAASGAFGLERQGNVPVPGERINLHREPPTASGNIPRRDSDRLPAPHRHEDRRQQVRAVVGVTDGPAGRGLGNHSLTEKVAGGSTREDGLDCNPVGARPQDALPTPATDAGYQPDLSQPHPSDAAPAVCEISTHFKPIASTHCHTCGKPIKFTEAK